MTAEEHVIRFEEVKGYVTVQYDRWWWFGMVTSLDQKDREVAINFLHPRGPARSLTYPERPDNLVVGMGDILTTVNPITAIGRTYTLKKEHECLMYWRNCFNGRTEKPHIHYVCKKVR